MLKDLKDYILENKFKIYITQDYINIINYTEIDHFDDKIIIIRNNKGIVTIKGKELIISKLLEEELLINGIVRNIEFK